MTALAHLETLLRARKLDVTLTTSALWRQARRRAARRRACRRSMRRSAEACRAAICRRSSGRARPAGRRCCAMRWRPQCARGEAVALIDPSRSVRSGIGFRTWPRSRGDCCGSAAPVSASMRRLTALKATNLVLQAGNFGLVALDLSDVPAPAMRAFPFTTWLRMARVIEGTPERRAARRRGASRAQRRRRHAGARSSRGSRARHVARRLASRPPPDAPSRSTPASSPRAP